ncbi:dihydropteroate synthase [Roseateles koreensis]|uniref:Dihydropteroate synthase n=1 Tax=Roseateles koreensis TaxID=2987526 RepID=A0ABT5KNB3_9BURK|nr:dihydropteroate synthase [Roseateles koreensis]MDC8784413.1 dihydropteroate synthase [Roseateles koreensis]
MAWQTTRFQINLDRPRVMGIVNVTPDSFSDGGHYANTGSAIAHCERLVAEGADILDIGGESSRPGASTLTADEEWSRLAPVLQAALTMAVPVSVDTCKPEVMRRALDIGVDIINDIHAFRSAESMAVITATATGAGLCAMHMRGDAATMHQLTGYVDVVAEVSSFLAERALALRVAGIAAERIVLDPGYGFAKTTAQNFELLNRQSELLHLGYPLLVGWSRKRSLGDVVGRPVDQRLSASLAAGLLALVRGAAVLRVHDVAATVDAVKVFQATTKPWDGSEPGAQGVS